MKLLLSYTRRMFWITGIITILLGTISLVSGVRAHFTRPIVVIFWLLFELLILGSGTVSCLAARALRKQARFAKTLVVSASIYNLLIFPFGTVAGAVGLYWCFSPKIRALEPRVEDFEYQSKAGDGTHKWTQRAMPVASVVVVLGSLGGAAWWGERHGLPKHGAINGLLLLLVCEWIATFFHELGHATAGWLVEMKLAAFRVGPLMAQKKRGKWKFGITLVSLLGVAGSVVTTPLHTRNLRRRMAMEIAGGPAASLLTAVVAMLILSMMPGSSWVAWWKVPAVVAAISAGAAVLNLIPFGFAAGHSDGALLVQLLLGGPFADMREALKIVGATISSPMRPRDVDPVALSRGLRVAAGRPEAGILQMVEVVCAIDRGDLASAREHLESALELIPSAEKADNPDTAAELGFYLAYLDGHAGRAGQWLRGAETVAAKKKFALSGEFDYWLSTVAVRFAEGRDQEADEAWRRAKALVDTAPHTGLYDYERDVLNRLKERDWLRPPEASRIEEPQSHSTGTPEIEIPTDKSESVVMQGDALAHHG